MYRVYDTVIVRPKLIILLLMVMRKPLRGLAFLANFRGRSSASFVPSLFYYGIDRRVVASEVDAKRVNFLRTTYITETPRHSFPPFNIPSRSCTAKSEDPELMSFVSEKRKSFDSYIIKTLNIFHVVAQ